jgi:serine-type D-Ala-D-Ala carboxypeptidase (penicillin-binding protein 5/6)
VTSVLLAFLANLLLGVPTPETLNDPARTLTEVIPEERVLVAETERSAATPQLVQETLGPVIDAESYVVLDGATGHVLTAKAPSAVRPVASLTKLLTALTVVHHAQPEDVVQVSARAVKERLQGSDMALVVGERLRVRDLLAGLLIPSANDAAVALAEHVSGSVEAFAAEMNRVAQSYGLARTHVVNPTGHDHPAHFSSSYDMAQLLSRAWRDELLGPLLRAETLTVTSVDGKHSHRLKTTNRLLGERTDILAGKTGFTDAAGQSLAIIAEDERGDPVIAVLLGSDDRFGDMENLLNWTFWAYAWPDENQESRSTNPG